MDDPFAATAPAAHDPGGRLFPLPPGVKGSAIFGGPLDCYRYMLERVWGEGLTALFLMMNPSCANPMMDDQTIKGVTRKVMGWSGYGRLLIANTFAYRCKDQSRLAEVADPIGPENDAWILRLAREADIVVFGYGKPKIPALRSRGPAVADMLVAQGFRLHVLGLSNDGTPKHPLYIRDDTPPVLWRAA